LRRLLLGEAEQLLDAGAEARIGGPLLLAELTVRLGQLLLERLNLLAVLTHLQVSLLEVLVNLVLVISAHDLGEVADPCVFAEVAEPPVDLRLHVAGAWLGEGGGMRGARRGSSSRPAGD